MKGHTPFVIEKFSIKNFLFSSYEESLGYKEKLIYKKELVNLENFYETHTTTVT